MLRVIPQLISGLLSRRNPDAKASRRKASFRPGIEGLEARELLTVNPAAALVENGGPTGMIVKMMTPYNGGVLVTYVNGSTYYTPSGLYPGGGGDGSCVYSGTQRPVAIAAVDGGVLTAFNSGGIYFSPNGQNLGGGGQTKLVENGGPTGMIVTMMTPYDGGVLVTYVNGSTYYTPSGLYPGGGGDGSCVYSGTQHPVAMAAVDGGVLTAFNGGGIYFSPNGQNLGGGGQTKLVENGGPTGMIVTMMTPYDGGVFVTYVNGSTYYTPSGLYPGGGDGTRVYSGSQHPRTITPFEGGVVTTFDGGGIYFSPNGQNLGGGGQTSLWGIDNVAPVSVVDVHGNLITALSDGKIFAGGAPDWFDDHVSDPLLAAVGRNCLNTSAGMYIMVRPDMLQVLFQAAADGATISASTFSSLQTIVANAAFLHMPPDVQNLAYKVADGDPANAHYQGAPLGNLYAGSSAMRLQDLVDKWFLGEDHPTIGIPGLSVSYALASGILFAGGVPTYKDVCQGEPGDCWLLAALGVTANSAPSIIQSMFTDDGTTLENGVSVHIWTVRFYDKGVASYVTVDNYLPAVNGQLVCASDDKQAISDSSNVLWVPLAEKAYAQLCESGWNARPQSNAYASLNSGSASTALPILTGDQESSTSPYASASSFISAISSGRLLTLATAGGNSSLGIVGDHDYGVLGYDASNQTFTLLNPWGWNNPGSFPGILHLTWAQLNQNFVLDGNGNPPSSAAEGTPSTTTYHATSLPQTGSEPSANVVSLNPTLPLEAMITNPRAETAGRR